MSDMFLLPEAYATSVWHSSFGIYLKKKIHAGNSISDFTHLSQNEQLDTSIKKNILLSKIFRNISLNVIQNI